MNESINTGILIIPAVLVIVLMLQSFKTIRLNILYPLLSIFAILVKWIEYGNASAYHSIAGAFVAIVISSLSIKLLKLSYENILFTIPIGALLGEKLTLAIISIAIVLTVIQKLLHSELELVPQYIFELARDKSNPLETDEKSALAEIEARRLLRSEHFEKKSGKYNSQYNGYEQQITELMPWGIKISIALLIVLLYRF